MEYTWEENIETEHGDKRKVEKYKKKKQKTGI